jgi:hypothetical protein
MAAAAAGVDERRCWAAVQLASLSPRFTQDYGVFQAIFGKKLHVHAAENHIVAASYNHIFFNSLDRVASGTG